jgi:O-acetylserine/cysteine efflux transporter
MNTARHAMPISHLALALLTVAIWGTNFVVIKAALGSLPPLLFATLRFALASLPLLLFIKRPNAPVLHTALSGLFMGSMFGLMFLAIRADIAPGLASLVVQSQVFFTVVVARIAFGEHLHGAQVGGLLIGAAGIALIGSQADANMTMTGLALILGAALSWACSNLVVRRMGKVDMLAFQVWSSLWAVPPLLLLSLVVEGPSVIGAGLMHAGWGSWLAAVWQAAGNTLLGYGIWNWLLARHSAAQVSPLAMLVPVFGMSSAALVYGERLSALKLTGAVIVMLGLLVAVLGPQAWERLRVGKIGQR